MRKRIALILAIVMMLAVAVAGCSNGNTTPDASAPAEEPATEPTAEAADDASDDATATDDTPEKAVKAGFIYIGPADDGGFSTSHDVARQYLESELGIETVYKELVPEGAEVEGIVENMIDQGCNMIFGCSYGYIDYMEAMAEEYPDVVFLHCSGWKSNDTNFVNYFGRIYEPRFLSGLVAGMKTETNKIGYVAAFSIPEVVRGLNAFALGVQAVNPDAKVEVLWTSDWVDATKAKEAANTLIDGGCDVIAQHQDATSPQQAAEEAGVFSIGYHMDMTDAAPNAYMTAPVWNWGPYYVEVVQSVMDGTFVAQNYWGGMKQGVVELAPLTANAPEGAQDKIDEYTSKIVDTDWAVFTGPLKDNAGNVVAEEGVALDDGALLSMNWLNENIIGSIQE